MSDTSRLMSVEFDGTEVHLFESGNVHHGAMVSYGPRNPDKVWSGLVCRRPDGQFVTNDGQPIPKDDPFDAQRVIKFVVVPIGTEMSRDEFILLLGRIRDNPKANLLLNNKESDESE